MIRKFRNWRIPERWPKGTDLLIGKLGDLENVDDVQSLLALVLPKQ